MKKFFAIALICIFTFFTACQSKMPPPMPQSFTAQARVTFGGKRFTAAVEQACPGSLRLKFAGPPELKGLVLQLEGGTAILRYGELELSLPTPSLPQAGFAGLLNEVLRQLVQPVEENVRRVAGGWELKGTLEGLPYTARVDMDGMLRGLHMPGAGLKVDLT